MSLAKIKLFKFSIESEMQQALARLVFIIWGLTFFGIGLHSGFYPISSQTFYIYSIIFTVYSIGMIFSIIRWPNIIWRLYFTAIFDVLMISLGIIFTGDSTSPFFFLYVWVFIGQAIQYGRNILFTTAATAIICYVIIIFYFADVNEHPLETLFFLLTLVIMPLYLDKLLKLLHKARHEADTANKSKTMFLANMSHELRTPLNAIIGYSEMLKEDADAFGYDSHSKDLSKIRNAGLHLLSLISSILDFSKIESGKVELDYSFVDIKDLLNDVSATVMPLTKKHNNEFTINCQNNISGFYIDKTKIIQMLLNLLSNACKFTENGKIELNVYLEKKSNKEQICFSVKDTGIGIAQDKFKTLFQPFIQATVSTTRLYGGTGLGLTISQHFVALMKGVIDVESTVGKGTTFTVTLPAHKHNPAI
jgi:signal transduction histidine kinase